MEALLVACAVVLGGFALWRGYAHAPLAVAESRNPTRSASAEAAL